MAPECHLRAAADGKAERCPGEVCPFWEPDRPFEPGDCVLRHLMVDLARPGLAGYLLALRERLEQARESGS